MKKEIKISLQQFIEAFPEVSLPVTLTEASQRTFSQQNDPFPQAMLEQYLYPLEEQEVDELTEYIPCFRLKNTFDFHAVVFWRASLMSYTYTLLTFSKNGDFIDKKVIAGTYSDGKALVQSVATIEEDWEILVVSGQASLSENATYDPAASTTYSMELLPEGRIITI